MRKSLVQKIAPYIFVGLSLIGGGCENKETLKVGLSKVTYKPNNHYIITWDICEKKSDGTRILYYLSNPIFETSSSLTLSSIIIDSKSYTSSDELVFNKAEKRTKFLVDRYWFVKDSTKKADDLARQSKGLKALE